MIKNYQETITTTKTYCDFCLQEILGNIPRKRKYKGLLIHFHTLCFKRVTHENIGSALLLSCEKEYKRGNKLSAVGRLKGILQISLKEARDYCAKNFSIIN